VDHLSAFDLYLYEDVRNGGGRGGNYSATIELDRTVSPSTDLGPCHLCAILVASGYAFRFRAPGEFEIWNRSCRMTTAVNRGTSCNSVHAMHS
jgi:hypothetical protein